MITNKRENSTGRQSVLTNFGWSVWMRGSATRLNVYPKTQEACDQFEAMMAAVFPKAELVKSEGEFREYTYRSKGKPVQLFVKTTPGRGF